MIGFKDFVLTRRVHRKVNAFRSRRYLFRIGYPGKQFKVFRLIYDKHGDIYISPYFNNSKGIVSVCDYRKGITSIQLDKKGKTTSHLVKFSHHRSGEVLFSTRSERVRPLVRRQSVPLHLVDHHFATIKLQGLEGGFPEMSDPTTEATISKKDQIITLVVKPEECKPYEAFAFRFYYRNLQSLGNDIGAAPTKSGILLDDTNMTIGPITILRNAKTGTNTKVVLLAPPEGFALSEKVMMISCEKVPILSKDEKSTYTMIGGFNSFEGVHCGKEPNEFLALIYPLSERHKRRKDLSEMIGTIDMQKSGFN
jgi:hypothetical protein